MNTPVAESLKLVLQITGRRIKRKFDKTSLSGSVHAKSFQAILIHEEFRAFLKHPDTVERVRHLTGLRPEDLSVDLHNWENMSWGQVEPVFLNFYDVPWYLDIIGKRLQAPPPSLGQKIYATIKPCKDHLFIDIYQKGDKGRVHILPPFFHKVPRADERSGQPPTDQEQANQVKIRGVLDALLFLAPTIERLLRDGKGINWEEIYEWGEIRLKVGNDATNIAPPGSTGASSKEPPPGPENQPTQMTIMIEPEDPEEPQPTGERVREVAEEHQRSAERIAKKLAMQCIEIFVWEDGVREKSKPILVASPNFRVALRHLAEAWHNPLATSILISAGTGSGKEELKNLLVYAAAKSDTVKPPVIEVSGPELAASSKSSFLERVAGLIDKNWVDVSGETYKLKPKKIIIYVDEVHYGALQGLREELLRFMSTWELPMKDNAFPCKRASLRERIFRARRTRERPHDGVLDCKHKILLVFAASEPPKQLRLKDPPDFWTRIENTVLLEHPLLLKKPDEDKYGAVLNQYFCFFWLLFTKVLKESNLKDKGKGQEKEPADQDLAKIIDYLEQDKFVEFVSKAFCECLGSPLIPVISIRMIRTLIHRLLGRTLYFIRTESLELQRIDPPAIPDSSVKSWIVEIFKEMVPAVQHRGIF